MHKVFIGLCLAGLIGAALPTEAAPRGPTDAGVDPVALTRGFFRTVFGLEYGGRQADAYKVKRYAGEVRFFVQDHSAKARAAEARAFLQTLPDKIGHLRAAVVTRREDANFRVILVDQRDFSQVVQAELKADALAMNARCLVGVSTVGGRIERSTAVIVADDDFLFDRCLVEEVLQGLGPMNDDASLVDSVFNDQSRHRGLTEFDRALMNVLYHPMIRPGMSGAEVHRMLPRVLADLGYAD